MSKSVLELFLDKTGEIPLYLQISDELEKRIISGELAADSKLPPIRKLAMHLEVNSVTVVGAYKHLESKRMVYARVGSGTFVSPLPIEIIPEPLAKSHIPRFEEEISFEHAINFADASLPHELFPVEIFKRVFNEVLDQEKGGAFRYTDSMGFKPLRERLSLYLREYSIKTSAEQIQIISGAQQGLDIIAKAMIRYGDVIFVEKPTFYGAAGAFLSRGAKIIEIPMEEDGMQMDMLEDYLKLYHPRFIYMMAYYQTPTGISYSMEKKRRLLELAEKYDTFVLEEDDFYDFHYARERLVPLKALDYKNRVVYIKSFSKILMPGLRMGLMVLPKRIQQAVAQAKYTTDISTSGFIQKAMALYLQENVWKEHAQAMCRYGREKYKRTLSFARMYLDGKVRYNRPNGGISLWLELPKGFDSEIFCSRMLERQVILTPGNQFLLSAWKNQHVRLSFTSVSDDKIAVGLKRMAEVIEQMESEA